MKSIFKQTSNESYWQALDQMVAYLQKPTFDYGYEMHYFSTTALESEVLFIQKHAVITDKLFLCCHSCYCAFFILFLFLERPRCGLSFDLQLDSQKKGLHEHTGNNLFNTSIILGIYLLPVLLSAFIVSFIQSKIFALLCLEKSTTILVN